MLVLKEFGERISGGKAVEVGGFPGIEVRRFVFRLFLSYPYTLSTDHPLEQDALTEIRRRFQAGEIALTYPHPSFTLSLPSPVVRKGSRYHRERRRLIRRAEERCTVLEDVSFSVFYTLYSSTMGRHGRKPIPKERMSLVYGLNGVETLGVEVEGEIVGVIMALALPDRYLLWQMGWREYGFLPTYLLHLGISRGFDLGYDTVDLGVSPSPASLKLKAEMGGDTTRRVYVIRWRRLLPHLYPG